MIQQNVFHKGIVSDIDNSIITNDSWVFPTQNIRIYNLDGQGYIATQVEGNEESFELSSGFVALGSAEYNGVLYIISHNPTTFEGEIGSYPSPLDWDDVNNSEKIDEYKPLKNLNIGGVRSNLRDIAFNFDIQHPIYNEMQISLSYDESVDIIFTDYKNNIRIINSGFKKNWTINNRMILQEKLDNSLNLI